VKNVIAVVIVKMDVLVKKVVHAVVKKKNLVVVTVVKIAIVNR